ncbi:uncharacterized protein LOC128392009 [Panonychus citri]|uniref:uncharacterized protein LOC128392009 n=1 Tax=Panonychus citri TaxID=50023 RepID=UPI002308335B|nr:uncharacterized protein LOC128392009 [Panonychus citri]
MCVFDPSSLTLCSPLVPITVAYSPIATSTALCPALPTLPTHHHHHHLSPLPTHHHHHHHLTPTLTTTPQPAQSQPPPPPQQQQPSLVTASVTTTQVVTTTSPSPQQPQQQQQQQQQQQSQQTTITTLPLPPPPPTLSLIPPPTSTTGYYIQAPPPPPQITTTTTSPINGCPPLIKPSPWNQSYGMEHVWMAHFTSLFKSYPHQWCLMPVESRPLGGNFSTFVDSAKVRFCCEDCGHGWTSMKGRVAFWFDLTNYAGYPQGLVAFKLFGQQCQKCKAEIYEPPMWYPEEVFKVLVNLFNRVGQNYYGFYYPPLEKTRRPGKPRTPHNSTLCQACKDGVCTNRK